MGDALKKTGAGNLFTVFGQPDSEIERTADGRIAVKVINDYGDEVMQVFEVF
ncbi:MAG: hypothetical protein LBK54_13025 [Propionibacteriaceae bacterium]|jgi:adenine-specific DNA-methyltransferase|nr:hypothetical protein [Propionibacteriaceae bacterium]